MWSLPISVEIDGTEYAIRNKCDYRVVLDVISALNDEELEMELELVIQTRTIDNLMKKIQKSTGRKKIEPIINELSKEVEQFNALFTKYKKSILTNRK